MINFIQSDDVKRELLAGAVSPVNRLGLHQGWHEEKSKQLMLK